MTTSICLNIVSKRLNIRLNVQYYVGICLGIWETLGA